MSSQPAQQSLRIPTFDDVLVARTRLADQAHRTPVLTSRTADARTGASVFFKAENLQRGGAFKFRGAYNAISALDPAARARGVIAFSSGNHAQAVAYAARLLGVTATIVMPSDAPAVKMAGTRGYGAEIVTYDRYAQDRQAITRALAEETGAAIIPPFDHPDVISGQGTAVVELIEETGPLDIILAPLGGGGLLGGSALAAAALSPDCKVYGVEPEAGNDGQQSLSRGEIVEIAVPRSIADGALTTALGRYSFPILQDKVQGVLTVSDAELVDAVRFFAERMKLVVEPTGCLAAAAVLTGKVACAGKRVGVVLSGGNVDLAAMAEYLSAR